jgi:hypothetical protein
MEEADSKKKVPPIWWTKVIDDLEKAAVAAQKSFKVPNMVIGITQSSLDGSITGYLIRQEDGSIGYYASEEVPHKLPVGVKIKGKLKKPSKMYPEPDIASYAFEVIRENIRLIPRLWLRKVLGKILGGEPITMKEDLKPFPEWVLLPKPKKKDKTLIDLLYRATRYEGIKGLARFNDLAD